MKSTTAKTAKSLRNRAHRVVRKTLAKRNGFKKKLDPSKDPILRAIGSVSSGDIAVSMEEDAYR